MIPDRTYLDPMIEQEMLAVFEPHMAATLRMLPARVVDVRRVLGRGHYGIVWATTDPCWIFKLTSDPWEALFALAQRKDVTGLTPGVGVVDYAFVQYLGNIRTEGRPVFAIVRSALKNVGFLGKLWNEGHVLPGFPREARELMAFKELSECIAYVCSMFSSPRDRKAFVTSVWSKTHLFGNVDRSWDEERTHLRMLAYAEDHDYLNSSDEELFQSFHDSADSEPGLVVSTAAKIALAIQMTRDGAGARDDVVDVWDVLGAYAQEGILLADVHLGNIGRYVRVCYPEDSRAGEDGWVISDPGHGVILNPALFHLQTRVQRASPGSVLVPWRG